MPEAFEEDLREENLRKQLEIMWEEEDRKIIETIWLVVNAGRKLEDADR
jgi:hypothetical protein